MILPAFNILNELRALIYHNLRGLVDDFRVCENTYRLYNEIEAVLFCITLCVQERPILALGFHLFAAQGGDAFLHEFGFLDAPGLVDLRGVHRHLVGARRHHIKGSVFAGAADIQVTRHRELLAFAVFGHLREEACELDEIACCRVGGEYFVDLDISEVFAGGFVFEFEVFGRHVADFVAVRCDVNFKDVFFNGGFHIAYVNWYAAEALLENLVMQSRCVCHYRSLAF